jgi:excisionase family DNA binding protein
MGRYDLQLDSRKQSDTLHRVLTGKIRMGYEEDDPLVQFAKAITKRQADLGKNAPEKSEWPRVFTPKTLAERWHCSDRHVRNLINKGELPAFRLGKLVRILVDDVQKFEAIRDDKQC